MLVFHATDRVKSACSSEVPRSDSFSRPPASPPKHAIFHVRVDRSTYLAMRLQISIRRHALPPINIIFTTGTGPSSKTLAPDSTVSDLLQDVNDLVPLESEEGEWGLEDYVVEVQATADQETYYECLHFQTIDSVLRDDDEVVIRCLRTEDLRSRRLGGRHQISSDGRHLIDGVAFGKQWLVKGSRPDVAIPPRKRRRPEIRGEDEEVDEQSTTLLQQIQELGYSNENLDEDEDEDEDEDYVDDEAEDEEDELSIKDEKDQPLRIKAVAEFDDADAEESETSDDELEDVKDAIMAGSGFELSDERKALLEEAEQLSESGDYHRLPSEATQSPRKGKRKRDVADDDASDEASDFEGFGTPVKPAIVVAVMSPVSSVSSVSMSDDTTDPEDLDLKLDSDSGSDDDLRPRNAELDDETSSSGSSSSEEPDSQTDTSDADSTSSDSTHSSDEEDMTLKESEPKLPSSSPAVKASSKASSASGSSPSVSCSTSSMKRAQGIPGEGSKVTKRNNIRAKKRSRLRRLKAQGLLPPNASFAVLDAFEEENESEVALEQENEAELGLESKKHALLQQLQFNGETEEEMRSETSKLLEDAASFQKPVSKFKVETMENITVYKDLANDQLDPLHDTGNSQDMKAAKENTPPEAGAMEADEIVPSQEIGISAQESFIGKATPKSTEKRAKLDLASSRRMLFSSLGLQNPKTPAAEQALREKLNNSAKSTPQRKAEEKVAEKSQILQTETVEDMDSWKDKIELSAVECDYDGVKLSTPPFPFKQGWDSNANMRGGVNKKKSRGQSKYESEAYVAQYAPDVSTLQARDSQSEQDDRPESRTLSLEEQFVDDMPRPADFSTALKLGTSDLAPGAVIAFKELDIQNFQPVISDFRVARVRSVQSDGDSLPVIEVMLSNRDWVKGLRLSDPLAIEDEEGLPEDGVRVKSFADLIEPKLLEASSVQVNATPAQAPDTAGSSDKSASLPQAQSSIVPESEEVAQDSVEVAAPNAILKMTHVEINTPRRNEITAIIKEAGFDSAIDENLLRPDTEPEQEPESPSSPAFHTRSHRSQRSSRSPVPASSTSVPRPRFDSPGLNDWDSSPLHPVPVDSSILAPSQTSRQSTPKASKSQINVAYPALSQLELDASGVSTTNDNSFQDAQRVSQPPEIDTSNLQPDLDTSKLHPEYPYDDFGPDESTIEREETQQSLASEIPESQSQPTAAESSKKKSNSFLGHGLDGHVSSDYSHGNDLTSNSDDSLPSLRGLTSSQNRKIKQKSRVSPPATRARKASISTSPPLSTQGKRLRNAKKRSATPQSDDGVELPLIKISESQHPRMSQIPAGSQIVDLTLSSDPPAPESDGDYEENVSRRTRNAKGRKSTRIKARSLSSEEDDEEEGSESGTGIGKRRFLTTKKWRSHV
jgi:hypothetical protein